MASVQFINTKFINIVLCPYNIWNMSTCNTIHTADMTHIVNYKHSVYECCCSRKLVPEKASFSGLPSPSHPLHPHTFASTWDNTSTKNLRFKQGTITQSWFSYVTGFQREHLALAVTSDATSPIQSRLTSSHDSVPSAPCCRSCDTKLWDYGICSLNVRTHLL